MKVSIDGRRRLAEQPASVSARSGFCCRRSLASVRSTGRKISSRSASASHLPDALIHRTPSSFIEVFPVLACTNNGSRPMRADNSRRDATSDRLLRDEFIALAVPNIPSPLFPKAAGYKPLAGVLLQDPQLIARARWCQTLRP